MNTKKVLENKLHEIYNTLKTYDTQEQNIGVLAGLSGVSLFQFHYARFMGLDEPADIGAEIISEVVEHINNGYTFPTFCSGIAGAGWVLAFLDQEEFIEIDSDDLLTDLDVFLFEAMKNDIEREYYDFLHGALGYGYYFLKRYEGTKSQELKNKYKAYIITLLEALQKSSRIDANGNTWWEFDLNVEEGTRGGNLSLSHGISSIINFLSRLYPHEDFKTQLGTMLDGAIAYVLSHKKEDHQQTALYPSWVYEGMPKDINSRLAWCYGDLGIGISLWRAGQVLNNSNYTEEALEMMKHSTKRKDIKEAGVVDTGHCHGAAGIANIYRFMFQETQDKVFEDAAGYWLDQLLKMAIHENGDAGFMQWKGDTKEYQKESNLLEGIAGIGLTIISFLATFETKWDECLLIN
ncbi:lanthionine synthetase C family protein [Aquimarina sp. AU474]|uniref:lanthionine synthetase C family protein n=1 Tax=Aquimarina sp. AU474 TaxID=2108529 RepID=UPI000D685DC2|nr:lanthionine synthetase C family protein [Aquimarina sp. AU474]